VRQLRLGLVQRSSTVCSIVYTHDNTTANIVAVHNSTEIKKEVNRGAYFDGGIIIIKMMMMMANKRGRLSVLTNLRRTYIQCILRMLKN